MNDLTLWVDAVCINQSDLPEKSQQVAVMGQIYRKCAQVQIWLGCDASQCRLTRPPLSGSTVTGGISGEIDPFSIIRLLADDRHISEWPCFHAQDGHAHNDHGRRVVAYKANDDFNTMCGGFLTVDQSPWWTRIWTVQEAILPRTGLLIYDTWTTSLQTITDCGLHYHKHIWSDCCRNAESKLPGAIRTALKEFCSVARNLHAHRIRIGNVSVELPDLQEQHIAYGFRECEDPRDKVYGLLGITDDPLFRPDYTLSKEEVFFQATYQMLCYKRGALKILTGPQYGPAPGKWASWVRDFDAPSDRLGAEIASDRYGMHYSAIFDASGSHKSNFMLLRAPPRTTGGKANQVGLKVVGRRVGNVAFVSEDAQIELSGGEGEKGRHDFRKWMLDVLDRNAVNNSANADTPSNAGRDLNMINRFWKALLGGEDLIPGTELAVEDFNKFTPAMIQWLTRFLAWLKEENSTVNMAHDRVVTIATHGRCCFETETNGQGLCYPSTCVGDEVWVLDGGKVPFVLRSTYLDQEERQALRPWDSQEFRLRGENESRESRQAGEAPDGYYQFIGDCYLDGYMNSEAVQNSTFRECSIVLV
jgi:hypothetical protein